MPISLRPEYPRCFAVRSLLARLVLHGLLFCILGGAEVKICAQEIQIKLVDGRNGHPLENTCVNVWVGNDRKEATAIPTDRNGTATLRLTAETNQIDLSHRASRCGLFGVINPVFKYYDDIRVNVGYVLCQPHVGGSSWLKTTEYPTTALVKTGIVSPNACGQATAKPKPGELIIFMRPLTWFEKWKQ